MSSQRRILFLGATACWLAASPPASAETTYGLTAGNTTTLVRFDTGRVDSLDVVGAVSGIADGMSLRAIDFRPADGLLYGVATNGMQGQLYRIDVSNGVATDVGRGFTFGAAPGLAVSMDFDPVADRIRVVTTNGRNYQLLPTTGAVASIDSRTTAALSDIAYSNNVPSATQTMLYGYAFSTNELVTLPSPDVGGAFLVGASGVTSVEAQYHGFDISQASGTAYMSLDASGTSSASSEFYTVDLNTGLHNPVGTLPVSLLDFAVAPPVPEPGSVAMLMAGLGFIGFVRRRRGADKVQHQNASRR